MKNRMSLEQMFHLKSTNDSLKRENIQLKLELSESEEKNSKLLQQLHKQINKRKKVDKQKVNI